MNQPIAPKFKGYRAVLTNHLGETSPCWVINYRESVKFKDGSVGSAFKVAPGSLFLTTGMRYDVNYSTTHIWVKAERVSKYVKAKGK